MAAAISVRFRASAGHLWPSFLAPAGSSPWERLLLSKQHFSLTEGLLQRVKLILRVVSNVRKNGLEESSNGAKDERQRPKRSSRKSGLQGLLSHRVQVIFVVGLSDIERKGKEEEKRDRNLHL